MHIISVRRLSIAPQSHPPSSDSKKQRQKYRQITSIFHFISTFSTLHLFILNSLLLFMRLILVKNKFFDQLLQLLLIYNLKSLIIITLLPQYIIIIIVRLLLVNYQRELNGKV